MADMTIRVNQSRAIIASISVGKVPTNGNAVWTNSAPAVLIIEQSFEDRCVVRGLAAGTATVTCTAGGTAKDIIVDVIGVGSVDDIELQPGF